LRAGNFSVEQEHPMSTNQLRLVTANDASTVHRKYVTKIAIFKGDPKGAERQLARNTPFRALEAEEHTARVFVIGSTARADVRLAGNLLPRHIMVLTYPTRDGVEIRVATLHPGKSCALWKPDDPLKPKKVTPLGGIQALSTACFQFEDYFVSVESRLKTDLSLPEDAGNDIIAPGEQISFYTQSPVRPVGALLSSIAGPDGGGHAVPALVSDEGSPCSGNLVIRSRFGSHFFEPSLSDLSRGILIGRSRRCVLGRGFNENDGLSRLHAIVMGLPDGVFAFDLASRYGLRDITQPTTLIRTARIDDGSGCLVYGAGHLVFDH
jgi:hypothetical protein